MMDKSKLKTECTIYCFIRHHRGLIINHKPPSPMGHQLSLAIFLNEYLEWEMFEIKIERK
jgi:hypothetical protein